MGVTPQLASYYARHGWLTRLGQGAYGFPGDTLTQHGAVLFLQSKVKGLHVGGKSALALQGVRHNLSQRETLILWGDARCILPDWFTSRFPARYAWAHLFDWPDTQLSELTLTTPPGATDGLRVSTPERAALELLYDVGTHQGMEEARHLFESLRNFRTDVTGRLLACCTSVKAVRLFLSWARETRVVDVEAVSMRFAPRVGSLHRWIRRQKDGTLLTLKPYG